MAFSCFYCNTETDLQVYFQPLTFACPNCNRVYIQNEGQYKFKEKFKHEYHHTGLELGSKAILKGKEYKLSGILMKKAYGSFYWKEYILHNEALEFVFLSEADGHWILLKEIDKEFVVDHHPSEIEYEGITLDLYDYADAQIVSALGYFDFDVTKTKVQTVEYINPPFMVSIEKTEGERAAFFGEHIAPSDIKKAFNVDSVPYRNGVGLVQPFKFNVKTMAITFCVVALLIVISNWVLNSERVEKQILDTNIAFDEFAAKDFVTPSFKLEGSAAPLSISVASSVDNSWANLQVTLVNEKTGEEIYANKDIEYYHGYTDGENWTEGSTSEDFNICGVSQGKYHLALTPLKAPEDRTNTDIYVKATWNKPSGRNVWLICIFMGVILVVMYYINRKFEASRWEDSSYSPYSE